MEVKKGALGRILNKEAAVSFGPGGLAMERRGRSQSTNCNLQTAHQSQRGRGGAPSFSPLSDNEPAPRLRYPWPAVGPGVCRLLCCHLVVKE